MTKPLLEIAGLTKDYGTGQRALDSVSFAIESPQLVGVIGSSGAGKSTLIRCINRLVEPTSGSVRLMGTDIPPLSRAGLRRMRRQIGMIFQEYNLVERLTVMQNVLTGRLGYVSFWTSLRYRYGEEEIRHAYALLDRVGLSGFENRRADALSGGQRQRVGIARALMQRPKLLLLDEPTASLDPNTSRQIMQLARGVITEEKMPALINIHDVALAQAFCDRIIGMRNGRLVFDGDPADLTRDKLADIYGGYDDNPAPIAQEEPA
ncbi:phosphonate ABC transporter ATP-binding protein [Aquamicrobium ahrensii]|uniref:Phosphonate transport system ATP-binding protein n=1 Tax=Aquamicrobium ahrensii TaxID=469551 RepID=A0ABV2KQM9_9HYPH